MAARSDAISGPPRAPLRPRSRKRWAAAAGITGVWALFLANTGSVVAGTIMFLLLAVAAIVFVLALRSLGVSGDHPWIQRLATRPWRDGRDVLKLGLRHLPEVFIVTPNGALLAPSAVELRMNPGDLASLTEMMDLGLINSSATDVYEDQISAHAVELASAGPAEVSVIGDPAVPAGRYRLRQGRPPGPAHPAAGAADFCGRRTTADLGGAPTVAGLKAAPTAEAGSLTVTEPVQIPLLRLVTRGFTAETRISGARAGRGGAVELRLPEVSTVSRVHASFRFAEGQWRITCLGRNGVTLNGAPLAGEQVISDCDYIGWGSQPDAMVSRVEIGWSMALPSHPEP
ncbi:MAG TPA: FHA domain-containing protein [Streptosporangiaceae bacterium]|nr:FHA domain-containing protein [Streptosporangiaceae bacterium]